jgi:DNA replication protein DnaC
MTCPQCKKEADAVAAEIASQKAEVEARALFDKTLRAAGVEKEYIGKSFDDYMPQNPSQESALTLCRRFVAGWEKAREGGYGIVLMGGCGTGKTHLANAIIKALLWSHKIQKAKYTRVAEIIRTVRGTWGSRSEVTEDEVLEYYANLDLLVIYELGVQAGSANEQQILFAIIDQRLADSKPVICLTNLTAAELQKVIGERLMDRLVSKCVCRLINGQSFRKPIDESVFD